MKYAVEMDPGAMIHIKFHKVWFRYSKVDGGGGVMQTGWRLHMPTLVQ
jgi:hypothetical protein